MKDIDFFMQPVRIRLTRKNLFDRQQQQTKMFKGSIYGGCFTIGLVILLITFFILKLEEMQSGSNDISKQTVHFNDFGEEHSNSVDMKTTNFLPSIAFRLNTDSPTKPL